jgi:hypothetical protein
MQFRSLLALVAFFLSSPVSFAIADDCDAIISDRLLNRDDISNESEEELAILSDICSSSFEEFSNKRSKSASAKYKLISGKFGSCKEEFNRKHSESCSKYSNEQHRKQSFFRAQQALSDKAIEAWAQCKQANEDLACWISSTGSSKRFRLNLKWRKPFDGETKVESSTIANGLNATKQNLGSSVFADGQEIKDGRVSVLISVEDPDDTVDVAINVLHDDRMSKSCDVSFVPTLKVDVSNSVLIR